MAAKLNVAPVHNLDGNCDERAAFAQPDRDAWLGLALGKPYHTNMDCRSGRATILGSP